MTDERVHTPRSGRADPEREAKSNRNLVYTAIASAIVALIVGIASTFGGRVMAGSDTSIRLTAQIERLLDDNKDQNGQLKDQSASLKDINGKLGELYTRREAQADREAFERRFQSLELRLADLTRQIEDASRRLSAVEAAQQFTRQFIIDKAGPNRRP